MPNLTVPTHFKTHHRQFYCAVRRWAGGLGYCRVRCQPALGCVRRPFNPLNSSSHRLSSAFSILTPTSRTQPTVQEPEHLHGHHAAGRPRPAPGPDRPEEPAHDRAVQALQHAQGTSVGLLDSMVEVVSAQIIAAQQAIIPRGLSRPDDD